MAKQKDSTGGRRASRSKPSFDEGIGQLEAILDQIESGEAPLEQCLKRYEQGVKLVKHCQSILDQAQRRIEELTPPAEVSPENCPAGDSEAPNGWPGQNRSADDNDMPGKEEE